MSTTAQTRQTTIPAGTWNADLLHSSVGFAVRHMVVSTFRGDVPVVSATLEVAEDGTARLEGVAQVVAIKTQDENLDAHIQAPDFLDAQRHPELRFSSTDVERDGEDVVVRGEMTLKGITKPVELRGTVVGPVEDPYGYTRLGLELTAKFDRREYDLNWQSPLPGGGLALGYEITISAHLELVKA